MARIKRSTNNVCPAIISTIGCGGLTLMMGPAAFLLWPALFAIGKKGMASEIDELTEEDSMRIIDQARRSGERTVRVDQTIGSNGVFLNLPMTRTYQVDFDDD